MLRQRGIQGEPRQRGLVPDGSRRQRGQRGRGRIVLRPV